VLLHAVERGKEGWMSTAVDTLIAALAKGERKPAPGDGATVRAHISKAPFNRERRPESAWSRVGESVVGCPHPSTGQPIAGNTGLTSLEYHVAKRIRGGQWRSGTTPEEYEVDCRHAAALASVVKAGVRIVPLAATQTRVTSPDFPRVHFVPGQVLLVVYDTAKSRITTAYYLPEADAPIQVYKYWVQKPKPVVLPISTP
jgi:hypothetical protein